MRARGEIDREPHVVDDGLEAALLQVFDQSVELRVGLPALVTVDLRIVSPTSVYSLHTDQAHKYAEGVRFAPLPAIMAAKKKPLDVKTLAELVPGAALTSRTFKFEKPPARSAGVKVKDAAELVDKLVNTAKVV